MNLYNLHDNPKDLHKHSDADKEIIQVFWDTYKHDPHELKKREAVIAKNATAARCYATRTLRAPFPAGEKAIFADAIETLEYAKAFGIRNAEVEKKIAKDSSLAYQYAKYVIKGRWPEGESAIAKSPITSFNYAHSVIKKPFPAGEEIMYKRGSSALHQSYLEIFPERREAFKEFVRAEATEHFKNMRAKNESL